ncbi:class I SAM-dependent methyltransferase [Brevundimonas sp. BAL450]|uniref:SAM-dependent methyltransferase n=2 Tax=Brevundimonas TaxID=41275 RepID=UPI0018C8E02D|nr:class I SAM-dependent methyltransferase [Brevundimonas sp. BAL450]MBG7614403.1 class I SAM-dependent methyltransferase [Brevundimonas sp. BAL450]
MAVNFNHIAYEALEVCNAVSWDAVREAVAAAGLKPGALALDLGAGNATVAIGLARDFGLKVRAVERDPVMAALASRRIAASGQGERVELLVRDSSEVLDHAPLPDLITVLGATDAAAPGLRDPVAVFARLKNAVAPGGRLLWGEPFWKAEPSAPLRQIVEMTNSYQTDAGWRTAAEQAGWRVVHVRHSTDEEWRTYIDTMDAAVRAWAAAHPEAPEAPRLIARADMQKAMFETEGFRVFGFGLYLFRALPLAARRLAA